ncbi:MAG: hypothetical protein V2A59_01085 [Candidatus Omnitrophota bacterium]
MRNTRREQVLKLLSIILALILSLIFIVRFGGPGILRLYVESGMGDCRKSPVLCVRPQTEIVDPLINEEYLSGLLSYRLPQMEISLPRDFKVVKELVTKVYYKKRKDKNVGSVAYLLYEKPDFFVTVFPQVKGYGIKNDYEFIQRVMCARSEDIKNISDTFFVIMKGIFTPDMGKKGNIKITSFSIADKKGFITYSLDPTGNYFDCNMFNRQGDFFKVYLKDRSATIDMDKLVAIIYSIKKI